MKRSYPILMALLAAIFFGAATPASKALLEDFAPFTLAGLLYLGAVVGVLPLLMRKGRVRAPWKLGKKNGRRLLGAIGLGGIAGPVLLLFGLKLASAASVSMWLNLELIATALLGSWIFREQLGARGWVGVAGTVAAAVLLTWGEGSPGVLAVLLVAGACFCWGFDNHFTALIDGIRPAEITLWKGLVAGVVNLGIGVALSGRIGALPGIGIALGVGAFAYGLSIVLYILSAQILGATRAQMIFASAPFFGVALSAAVLGEAISALQVGAAGMLVLSLVFLFLRNRHTHEHKHDKMEHEHWHRHDDGHHTHVHEGQFVSLWHCHPHEHQPVTHTHPHWPDLHHRHEHAGSVISK
jgi:drug/metabolite transporter (DMT)-like permease